MNYLKYKENKNRGTFNFPIEFYLVKKTDSFYNMEYHWHTEIELIKILKGEFPIKLNGNLIIAKENDILFISPEILHGGTPKNCIYECIVCDANMLIKNNSICNIFLKDILNSKISINFDIYKNKDINYYLNKIFSAIKEKNIGYEFLIQGYLYITFGIIIEKKLYSENNILNKSQEKINQLKNVLEYIELEYQNTITLEDLSEKMNLNPKYFTKIFKQMTGKTPIKYLNEYRIKIACDMLLLTNLSITEICIQCGFNDVSYFIKFFKKEKNISPKKFRTNKGISPI